MQEAQGRCVWKKPPPQSFKTAGDQDAKDNESKKRKRKNGKGPVKERLLKEFSCLICRKVMVQPLTTPCAHNFCKACLEGKFAGQSLVEQTDCGGRSTLWAQKNVMKCPSCQNDITQFLQNPQVNRELQDVIESLQTKMNEEAEENKNPYVEEGEGTDVDEGEDSKHSNETSNDKENFDVNAGPDSVEMGEDASKGSLQQSEADRRTSTRSSKRMKLSDEAAALASDSDKN